MQVRSPGDGGERRRMKDVKTASPAPMAPQIGAPARWSHQEGPGSDIFVIPATSCRFSGYRPPIDEAAKVPLARSEIAVSASCLTSSARAAQEVRSGAPTRSCTTRMRAFSNREISCKFEPVDAGAAVDADAALNFWKISSTFAIPSKQLLPFVSFAAAAS